MHTNTHVTEMLRSAAMGGALALSSWLLVSCSDDKPVGTPVFVAGAPATNGVFDAALTQDGSGGLWMSYSTVNALSSDPLLRINTRIAVSSNAGSNWTDAGVALNAPSFISVPDNQGAPSQAVWQHEVSRLLYDPNATTLNTSWKIFWHRYPAKSVNTERLFRHGWIGVATAPTPTGQWSSERKWLVGSLYDPATAAIIGAPEYTSTSLAISDCPIFTEPGALVTANNIYISLKCAGGTVGKVVLLRCNHDLGGCTYRGNLLLNTQAQQFNINYNGFSATELVTVGSNHYLIVTPTELVGSPPDELYRGCLVFQIADLDTATLTLVSGNLVPVKSVAGTTGSFNGACGYTPAASASGIIYGQIQAQGSALQFGLYGSGVNLP